MDQSQTSAEYIVYPVFFQPNSNVRSAWELFFGDTLLEGLQKIAPGILKREKVFEENPTNK